MSSLGVEDEEAERSSEDIKKELSGKLKELQEVAGNVGKGLLIGAGVGIVVYQLIKLLSSNDQDEAPKQSQGSTAHTAKASKRNAGGASIFSGVTNALKEQLTELLIDYLRTRVEQWLNELANKELGAEAPQDEPQSPHEK